MTSAERFTAALAGERDVAGRLYAQKREPVRRQSRIVAAPAESGLCAVGDLQLRKYVIEVVLDCLFGERKPAGNGGVGQALGEQRQNVLFALG